MSITAPPTLAIALKGAVVTLAPNLRPFIRPELVSTPSFANAFLGSTPASIDA